MRNSELNYSTFQLLMQQLSQRESQEGCGTQIQFIIPNS